MKRTALCLLCLCLGLWVLGCGAKLDSAFARDTLLAKGQEVVGLVNAGDFAGVEALVREDLREALSEEVLLGAMEETLAAAGSFEEYKGEACASAEQDGELLAVVQLNCAYENANILYTLSFNKDYELVGFYFK